MQNAFPIDLECLEKKCRRHAERHAGLDNDVGLRSPRNRVADSPAAWIMKPCDGWITCSLAGNSETKRRLVEARIRQKRYQIKSDPLAQPINKLSAFGLWHRS